MPADPLSRRDFLRAATVFTGAAALPACRATAPAGGSCGGDADASERALPHRPFGRTGVRVPILGLGTAPAGVATPFDATVAIFEEAIDRGVTYVDTAPELGGYGHAQRALGEILPRRRGEVFLATKCWRAKGDEARALLERNLTELKTDRADLVYAHSVGSDEMDPETVIGRGGCLEALAKAKAEGLTRFIGITGHSRPARFLAILERFEIDAMMCAVSFVDRHTYGFEEQVFPVAAKKGVALVAMKVFGGMRTSNAPGAKCPAGFHELALRYALGLSGLALAVIGMTSREELAENLERARAFRPLAEEERRQLLERGKELSEVWGAHLGPVS